jgi:hypothetical protein
MRKSIIMALLTLLLAGNAQAFPWKKVLAAGVATSIHAYGLKQCRRAGREHCEARYGNAWWSFGTVTALDFAVIPISQKIGGKQGAVLSYGTSGAVAGFGLNQWHHGPASTGNVDMSGVVLVHRQ